MREGWEGVPWGGLHIHARIRVYTRIHTRICMDMPVRVYMCMRRAHVYGYTCVYVHTYTPVHVYAYTHVYVYTYAPPRKCLPRWLASPARETCPCAG